MAITVNEIAEQAGVSRTTVLRALNENGSIRKETRDKILKIAEENNYRPNLLARSLNHGRTMHLGVVAINIENIYFVQHLNAINRAAEERGYFTSIAVCDENLDDEMKLIQQLTDRQIEGLIINPVNKGKKYSDFLKSLNIPIVCIGNRVDDSFTTVKVDERKAAFDAFHFIVSKGYEKVIFVCPPLEDEKTQNIYTHRERLAGYHEAAEEDGKTASEVIGTKDYLTVVSDEMKKNSRKRTAFLCSGDLYALEIMKLYKEHGYSVPGDVGVMGFDNLNFLKYVEPYLTTVSTNIKGVGAAAVDELIKAIETDDYEPKTLSLNFKIMDRESL